MSIPTTLTIYVPDAADTHSIALRAGLRAALMAVYVGPREGYPLDDDGRAWNDAGRLFFNHHPGLLDVVTFGGTAVFRNHTKRGDHDFRLHIPEGMDYDHHCDADAENGAEIVTRRGNRMDRWPSDNQESLLVRPEAIRKVLAESVTEASLRDGLARLCDLPPLSYSVRERRYEEDWP